MTWLSAAVRIGTLLAVCASVGWYYGKPLVAVTCALAGLVVLWLYQMYRVQQWLRESGRPPPEIYGIWGDLLSQIHQLQKRGGEARARLQSTVDYLEESFASMRDGVAIVDDNGGLKWFNESARRLLGLRESDRGQSLMNLLRNPEFLRYFNRGDYSQPLQYAMGGDSGAWHRVEITRFGDGDRLLFIRDVTAEVRMEKVRKDFVANVSHELRTPLTVISGYLGTFLSDTSRLEQRYIKPLQQMLQQAVRMENLLKDLLLLSRIESEQGLEPHGVVDISALLAELQDELRTAHPGRRVELAVDEHAGHTVCGDYRELYSAVSNLVLNAIKYSAADSPVTVAWRRDGANCVLEVRDRGIGIDRRHLPRLTERFYRVEDSRASSTGGTGLGLAIVKHVAASHGARLEISSELGKGSVFSLVFGPQTQVAATAGKTSAAPAG
ncbi:MAG: phosphate regulon sensor histidine kinase PhoR [Halieaceae bacterium]|nr:phosphate regulon sensor histidine kinase PhoR [Halieaceae bacterium]